MSRVQQARIAVGVAAALLISLTLGAGVGLAARTRTLLTSERIVYATGNGKATMCVGEKAKYSALVLMRNEYEYSDGTYQTVDRPTGQKETVEADLNPEGIVTIVPTVYRQGLNPRLRRANFTVTAVKEGTTKLSFWDGQETVFSDEEEIEVVPCHYEIEIKSTWRLNLGFAVTMRQTVTRMRLDGDPADGEYFASPNALNAASAPGLAGCDVLYTVPRSIVAIKATEDLQRRGRLQIEIAYLPIASVHIEIKCPNQPKRVEGAGNGLISQLTFSLNVTGGSRTKVVTGHVLTTEKGSAGGRTTITVYKVPN
jgi:hypothetical protein